MNLLNIANNLYDYSTKNLLDQQFDAILIVNPFGPVVGHLLTGAVYFDNLLRFEDGKIITTSKVKEILPLSKLYYLAKTENSTYLCVTV